MNNALRKFGFSLLCLLALVAVEPRLLHGQVNGDASISGPVFGHTLTISTSNKFAGAISSLWWNNKQFVDTADFGREFQTAAQFFGSGECYNPTEGGSWHDGLVGAQSSSSVLLDLSVYGTTIETENQMAWWLSKDDPPSPACFDGPRPPDSNRLSPYQVHKTVSIGFAGLGNVIEYKTRVWIPSGITVTTPQVEPVAAWMPYEFTSVFTYDHVSKNYRNIRGLGGEDEFVKVRSTPDGNYAMALYAPLLLQPYSTESSGYRWGLYSESPATAILGGISRGPTFTGPGHMNFDTYLVVGTKAQVKTELEGLHFTLRALDPDVFNWRDYIAINGLGWLSTSQYWTAENWKAAGINEGKDGSKTFSPKKYLELFPDLAAYYGPTNYQGAIDHYLAWGRKEGRSTVAKVACGYYHLLGYKKWRVKTAGYNGYGQLGNGNFTNSSSPGEISSLNNTFNEVASGAYHSFVVKSDGTLWMWGANQWGARGNGSVGGSITSPVPVPFPPVVINGVSVPTLLMNPTRGWRHSIASGFDATAAVDSQGWVWTWGSNYAGKLGDGTTNNRYTPARVKKSMAPNDYLTGIVSVSVATDMMAALDADETVWTWGRGTYGMLGNNSTANSSYPVQVVDGNGAPLVGITQVTCGGLGFCLALARNGLVWGWGSNANSQLGTAAGGYSQFAKVIPGIPVAADIIAVGTYHGLAHGRDGKVYGWGYNNKGQLGNGSTSTAQAPPVQMSLPNGTDVIDLAAGGFYSAIVDSQRNVWVTGDNQYGQLGLGNQNSQYVPVVATNF